jgi:nicotinamidase-related amidase
MELGFHVTLVRDGTAARSHEAMHATLTINGPTFAHEILTTAELVSEIRRSASAENSTA